MMMTTMNKDVCSACTAMSETQSTLDEDREDALGDGAVAEQRVTGSARDDVLPDVQPLRSTVDEVTAARHRSGGGGGGVTGRRHRGPEGDVGPSHADRSTVTARVD